MVELTLISGETGELLVDTGCISQNIRLQREKSNAIMNLKKLANRKQSGSSDYGLYFHHYIWKEKVLYLTICSKFYPRNLSGHFLKEVLSEFEKVYKNGKATCLQSFGSAIQKKQKVYTSLPVQVNYWSSIIRYSDAVHLVEISDDEFRLDENCKKEAVCLSLQQNETGSQKSVVVGPYCTHCMVQEGIVYITVCDKLYPTELAVAFLNMLRKEFDSQFGNVLQYSKTGGSLSSFGAYMKRISNLYWDTKSERVIHSDVDEKSQNLNQVGVRKMQEHHEADCLHKDAHGRDLDEISSPLKIADGGVQDTQLIEKKNSKDKYFRMDAKNGEILFELDLEAYEDLFLHQREALRWLWSLHCEGKGGILADDMGLGKTRTVLAFLVGLFHSNLIKRALIIVPRTIVDQWDSAVFESGLENISRIYTNPKLKSHQRALQDTIKQGGLLVTSYEVVRDHHQVVVDDIMWDYIFLDEGHRLKNMGSGISKVLNNVECDHKILVTGTPIQNNLLEFYALVNLFHPNLLGTEMVFRKKFSKPIQKGKHKDATPDQIRVAIHLAEELNRLVSPFMLRRTKKILIASKRLPEKKELIVWLKMDPSQVRLFEKFMSIPNYKISGAGLAASQVAREICNHPLILKQSEPGERKGLAASYVKRLLRLHHVEEDIWSSCKISFLLYLVPVLLKQKHKILIFSQSRPMLKIVERALQETLDLGKNMIMRMDGDTPQNERDAMTRAFQPREKKNSKSKTPSDNQYKNAEIFLMTTYVGGVGLNLTRATRVILIDPAKNPSTDSQSVDRAYRLGQKKDVIVYRLMTCGTIEEHTYREQILKGELASAVIENKQCKRSMSKEKHRVLIIPKGGFDKSVTHEELLELFDDDFGLNMRREIRFLRRHDLVASVSNHSLLFTIEEKLHLTSDCGSSRSKTVLQCVYRKKPEIVTGGEAYALQPGKKDEWVKYTGGPEHGSDCRLLRGYALKKTPALGTIQSNRREPRKPAGPSGLGQCPRQFDRQFDPGKGSD